MPPKLPLPRGWKRRVRSSVLRPRWPRSLHVNLPDLTRVGTNLFHERHQPGEIDVVTSHRTYSSTLNRTLRSK